MPFFLKGIHKTFKVKFYVEFLPEFVYVCGSWMCVCLNAEVHVCMTQ